MEDHVGATDNRAALEQIVGGRTKHLQVHHHVSLVETGRSDLVSGTAAYVQFESRPWAKPILRVLVNKRKIAHQITGIDRDNGTNSAARKIDPDAPVLRRSPGPPDGIPRMDVPVVWFDRLCAGPGERSMGRDN